MLRFALVAGALALGACASSTADTRSQSASRDCFRSLDVRGYSVVDDHSVKLRISPAREYILTIPQNSRDLDWTHAISVRSSSNFICVGDPSGVQLLGGDPPMPFQVTNIERVPPTTADQGS
ncbi:DUF6491 family protein [Candidatus Viadribacter manganicus]|uniref:Lipoprotein n=1 Tax=Candidatus Viadribacter manganicus TaxID=1759059 RepID=A0A1B1AKW0_9PROT|nr:DUF6491 family protein [Candidatus Viadribacter manganicus]ANP47212.1 hypothetical protein ATE48_15440 [Candidatus Viadribacter manganicus]